MASSVSTGYYTPASTPCLICGSHSHQFHGVHLRLHRSPFRSAAARVILRPLFSLELVTFKFCPSYYSMLVALVVAPTVYHLHAPAPALTAVFLISILLRILSFLDARPSWC